MNQSLGQTINALRTQKGMSQTELAEVLDVSRQSISKWETDAALPEIDKLIALSRCFGVPVGKLLGLEEGGTGEPSNNGDGELSETQLKMVQEIVDRYLAAQPKPMSKQRKRILRIAVCAAAVCFAAGLFRMAGQLRELNHQYNDLQFSISNVTNGVNYQIGSISNRVEEILKQQNSLTADYGTEILRLNVGEGRILFSAYAVPKTYVEGMSVKFIVDDGTGGINTVTGEESGRKFTGTLAGKLTDSISLSAVFALPDGTQQTQLLDTYTDLHSDSVPLVYVEERLDASYITDQKIFFEQQPVSVQLESYNFYRYATAYGSAIPGIKEVRAGLFRNKQLVTWLEKALQSSGDSEVDLEADGCYAVYVYDLPKGLGIPISAGDEFCVAAVIEDEAGRQFICTGDKCVTIETGKDGLTAKLSRQAIGGYDYAISEPDELAEWKY